MPGRAATAITGRSFPALPREDGLRPGLVIRRTAEERARSPDKLNLDGRGLESAPTVEGERELRLLNLRGNGIHSVGFLGPLPALIFLDLYGNRLEALDGLLANALAGLRVLMLGKNRLGALPDVGAALPRLDVLDLHANSVERLDGLLGCARLRVLNLAANRVASLEGLGKLTALAELNLRRNQIEALPDMRALVRLQKLQLGGNCLARADCLQPLLGLPLLELSVDQNPVFEARPELVRRWLVLHLPSLELLNAEAVGAQERSDALVLDAQSPAEERAAEERADDERTDDERTGEERTGEEALVVVRSDAALALFASSARGPLCALWVEGVDRARVLARLQGARALSRVRALRLTDNGICSLAELGTVLALLPALSELRVDANPVCACPALRSFVLTVLPALASFNSLPVAEPLPSSQRSDAEAIDSVCSLTRMRRLPDNHLLLAQALELAVRDVADICVAELRRYR